MTISSSTTAHHKPTLIIQDQSLYSRQISDNLIKQTTNPHIVNHPKIISYPSPCKNNHRLKLLTLYLVGSEWGCAKLEKPRMERSCNGLKGDDVQSSQWMDVGKNKVKVWEVSKVLL